MSERLPDRNGRAVARTRLGGAAAALAALVAVACGSGSGNDDGSRLVPEPSGVPGAVSFTPERILLDNPTSPGGRSAGGTFTVEVVAYDASGRSIAPSARSPLTVAVYGAPDGAVTPTSTTITSGGSATFSYDGSFFAVPMTLAAWIDQPSGAAGGDPAHTAGGTARSFGRTHVLHGNAPSCAPGSTSYSLPLVRLDGAPASVDDVLESGLKVEAAVGYGHPRGEFAPFQVDTGSTGVLVPYDDIGRHGMDTGTSGVKFYDSSGRTYSGRYFMAPVSFRLADGSVATTAPIQVLGVQSAHCAPGYPRCHEHPPSPEIHYLGVGFDRGSTETADLLDTPADNVFLQLAGTSAANASPGYVLTTRGITVGITSTDGFALQQLTPSSTASGDWNTASGCFAFPDADPSSPFCGTLLLDVGIPGMFLAMPKGERPEALVDRSTSLPTVPVQTAMEIIVGTASDVVTSYAFTVSDSPDGPAPTSVTWVDSASVFVNTGRRPLAEYDYLYDARCGNVGFKALD